MAGRSRLAAARWTGAAVDPVSSPQATSAAAAPRRPPPTPAPTVARRRPASSTKPHADDVVRAGLLEEIIRLNMVIAGELARRYHGRGSGPRTSTRSRTGLVKAVQGFDPAQGNDFLSFAVPTIRGEIRRTSATTAGRSACRARCRRCRAGSQRRRVSSSRRWAARRAPARSRSTSGRTGAGRGLPLRQRLLRSHVAGCSGRRRRCLAHRPARGLLDPRSPPRRPGSSGADPRRPQPARPADPRDALLRWLHPAEIGAEIGVTQMQVSRLLARLLDRLRRRLESEAA